MTSFFNAVSSVLLIFLLTSVGYLCAAKGWMGQETKAFISKLLMNIAIPCMCIYGLTTNLTRDAISSSGALLLVPFLVCTVSVLLALAIGKLMKLPRKRLGIFVMMCSLSNAIFVGYAMCSILFGESCTPYVMLFYLVNTSFVQIVGIPSVIWSGESSSSSRNMPLKFLRSPAVLSVFVAFALILANVSLPPIVVSFTRYLNNIVTPLALILTGHIIYEIGLKNLRIDSSLCVVMLFRFLLSPVLAIALCAVFGVTGLARSVIVVECAMPVVTQTVVAASEYHADAQYAAQGAALTTLVCFFVIPVLMLLL